MSPMRMQPSVFFFFVLCVLPLWQGACPLFILCVCRPTGCLSPFTVYLLTFANGQYFIYFMGFSLLPQCYINPNTMTPTRKILPKKIRSCKTWCWVSRKQSVTRLELQPEEGLAETTNTPDVRSASVESITSQGSTQILSMKGIKPSVGGFRNLQKSVAIRISSTISRMVSLHCFYLVSRQVKTLGTRSSSKGSSPNCLKVCLLLTRNCTVSNSCCQVQQTAAIPGSNLHSTCNVDNDFTFVNNLLRLILPSKALVLYFLE